MKNIFTIIAFLVLSSRLLAQTPQSQILRMDTIDVSGKIISIDGSKVSRIWIQSRTPNKQYAHSCNEGTYTDSLGNFSLKGLKPIDTLSFRAFGADHTYINQGSRFITIKISPPILESSAVDRPQVIAKRIKEKKKTNFVLTTDEIICIYPALTTNAQFPGGVEKFIAHVNKNLVYPSAAIESNIEGNVTVAFSIFKDGSIRSPEIINGLGHGCDEAAVDAILKSPKWVPATENGKPVVSPYQIDISFKIKD